MLLNRSFNGFVEVMMCERPSLPLAQKWSSVSRCFDGQKSFPKKSDYFWGRCSLFWIEIAFFFVSRHPRLWRNGSFQSRVSVQVFLGLLLVLEFYMWCLKYWWYVDSSLFFSCCNSRVTCYHWQCLTCWSAVRENINIYRNDPELFMQDNKYLKLENM